MFVDEFVYHQKRRLGRWESLGHTVDSFFFLLPFLYCLYFEEASFFYGICIVSTLIITKDEFVHNKECGPAEQWLHSALFIIHPIALFALKTAWDQKLYTFIKVQAVIIGLFMLYQFFYWNIYAKQRPSLKA